MHKKQKKTKTKEQTNIKQTKKQKGTPISSNQPYFSPDSYQSYEHAKESHSQLDEHTSLMKKVQPHCWAIHTNTTIHY